MSKYIASIDGSGWAVVAFTVVVAAVMTAAATFFSARWTENRARERAAATAEREQCRHEWAVLQAGYAALQRGDPLDLMIHEGFWQLVEKEEARSRALGSTRKSVSARFPSAGRLREEAEEQRDAGTERGSFQQSPATHGASSRSRSRSPAKAAGTPRLGWTHSGVTFDHQSFEGAESGTRAEPAGDSPGS